MLTTAAAALGATLLLALLLPVGSVHLRRRTWLLANLGAAAAGAIAGVAVGAASRGVHTTPRLVAELAVGAALGTALLNLGPTSWRRRLVALATIPCLALVAVGVTIVIPPGGAAPGSVTSLLAVGTRAGSDPSGPVVIHSGPGYPGIARWAVATLPTGDRSGETAGDRRTGAVGSVVIPGTRSRFHARPAIIYLPPAALTTDPPRLPVVVAFSGQSRGAGPQDVFAKGRMASIVDGIAQRHNGVAPIVIVPDQLGPGSPNPMCVDSALGNVATYITSDVRDWALAHLRVSSDRRDWTIAGFSEGGTCAIQFGAGRPDLFGSLIDVSGEEAPRNGTVAHTISVGFKSAQAYAAASPLQLLATHRYPDTEAFFTAGALDRHYGPVAALMAARAGRAGMTVHYSRVPALGHNWVTAGIGLRWGLDSLASFWPAEAIDTHDAVQVHRQRDAPRSIERARVEALRTEPTTCPEHVLR